MSVIEVRRNGDHRRFDRFTQIGARVIDQFADDAGHKFLGCILPFRDRAGHPDLASIVGTNGVWNRQAAVFEFVPVPSNKAFEVGERVAWAEHELASGELTDNELLILAVPHH